LVLAVPRVDVFDLAQLIVALALVSALDEQLLALARACAKGERRKENQS
jgi:hypothetical protein